MLHSNSPRSFLLFFLVFVIVLFHTVNRSVAHDSGLKRRTLMAIKETPSGGNVTFDCSPSGPCIPCSRSEKSDKKYRCDETGYRIRLKCVALASVSKDEKSLKAAKTRSALENTDLNFNQHDTDLIISSTGERRLLANSSKSKGGSSSYLTYRSCLPAVNEEKLSVLGFEALMLALLISTGSFIFFRRKRFSAVAGGAHVRLPTSSMF